MWILREPGRAERLGLIGQKARFVGQAVLVTASVGEILLVALLGCLLMPVVAWIAALGKGLPGASRLRALDAPAGDGARGHRLGQVVPVVDRAALRGYGGTADRDARARQPGGGRLDVRRGRRGHHLAVHVRRQPPVGRGTAQGYLLLVSPTERSVGSAPS